jgi:hypothetical protein
MAMKTIRKDWPRVRQYVKAGNTYYQVDLRRKHYQGPRWKNFTDRSAALKYAGDIGEKVAKDGLSSISVVGSDPRVQAWSEQFAIYGKTIEQAVDVALAVFEKERKVKESPYMADLLSLWIDDKCTGLKKLRPRTLKSIRNMANMFKTDFGMTRMKEIDEAGVEAYLAGKNVSDQTQRNICSHLGQFFNWSIRKKYHDQNPADGIEIDINRGSPGFSTVEQRETLMQQAMKEEHQPMTAYFAGNGAPSRKPRNTSPTTAIISSSPAACTFPNRRKPNARMPREPD